MTAVTVSRVAASPSEAEIREALAALEAAATSTFETSDLVTDALAPILDSDQALVRRGWAEGYYPSADHPGTLWADLRPAEAAELYGAIETVLRAASRSYVDAVREGVVRAALAFAEAHPDVPRGHWPNLAR